jgi:hypothetical protein
VSHVLVASTAFLLVFASALLGLYIRGRLPDHHLSEESSSAIKLAVGLVATIAALVLGLLISSAKASFDTVNNDFVHNAADIVRLDLALAEYGPQTALLRAELKESYSAWIELLSSPQEARTVRLDNAEIIGNMERFQHQVAQLTPHTDVQRQLQARALNITDDVFNTRSRALLQRGVGIPAALLVVLVLWLAIIFGTFGILAPRNATIIVAFFLCAISSAGAIFLILEMDTPLAGIVRVSIGPMQEAVLRLGR